VHHYVTGRFFACYVLRLVQFLIMPKAEFIDVLRYPYWSKETCYEACHRVRLNVTVNNGANL
jgi:hypothetical protein